MSASPTNFSPRLMMNSGNPTAPQAAPLPAAPPREAERTEGGPIRVALDLRMIEHSGIGSYLRGLLEGFGQTRLPVEWSFIGPRDLIAPYIPRTLRVREIIEFNAPIYGLEEFRRHPAPPDADVLHFPHYNLPLTRARRVIVTVYDTFHITHGSLPKRVYQRFFLSRLAWKKARVAAISAKTRDDILAHSRIKPERISVIPLGPGRSRPERAKPLRGRPLKLPSGRVVEPPWLLAVGINKPHKNMNFLLRAMAMWSLRRQGTPPLVWIGPDKESIPGLLASVPAYGRERIILEPYSPEAPIDELYAGAGALVFPSLDEGFGFPPLEAMARKVPVVCSRRRPMTDMLGDAPLWFDPTDSTTLWRALDRLIDDPQWAAESVERGLNVARGYSWAETARRTFELYAEAAGRGDLAAGLGPT